EYQLRLRQLEEAYKDQEEVALGELQAKAESRSVSLVHMPSGYTLLPTHEGEVLEPEAFEQLPAADQARFQEAIDELQDQLQQTVVALSRLR
ncbi:MAG: AAA family ATPase, partial [Anaerolineae bacterium]|nr:AAA family ATPase [Anaerolineae bacterium]